MTKCGEMGRDSPDNTHHHPLTRDTHRAPRHYLAAANCGLVESHGRMGRRLTDGELLSENE